MKKQKSNALNAEQNSRPELRLDWCSYEAANYAVRHWHYSRSMPIGKLVKIGVWEDGNFVGCIIFGFGGAASLHKQFHLGVFELCELVRIALRAHSHPVTRMVKIALSMLKKHCPKLRLVVSYADPFFDHHGGIYQAGNWIYFGESAPGILYEYLGSGKITQHRTLTSKKLIHNRNLQGPRGFGGRSKNHEKIQASYTKRKNDLLRAGIIRTVKRPRKHKYIFPLNSAMRMTVAPLSKPYPKRAGSKESVALGNHPREGGVNPTPALHQSTSPSMP